MAEDDLRKDISANQMLLEVTENQFSDKTEFVKNLLKSSRELFSQEVLDKSLLSCCRKNRLFLLPAIISAGANFEVTDQNGNTALLVCALHNNENCARCLIGAGADVNTFNFDGDTPLIVSVLNSSYIGMTKLLIGTKKIKIDHENNKGYTALLYAIETVNLNAMKLLIDVSDVSGINKVLNETVLKDMENRKILRLLIHLFTLHKVTGKSPFLYAALDRDIESAQIMISMDESIVNTTYDSFAFILIKFLESIQDNNNIVNQPELEMFEFILKRFNSKSLSLREKKTIVDIVISIADQAIVELLSKFDFVISYQNLRSTVSKTNFLCFLLTKRHVINTLDHNNQPVYEGSPLHEAMIENEIESAKALIQNGAFMDIDQALEDAVKWNLVEALQFLLSKFPDQVGQKLNSPKLLHNAVINSALNIIPILLDNGADINAEYKGDYCLTQIVDVNVLELLLSRGADPNVKIGSSHHTYPIHTFLSGEFENAISKMWLTFGVWAMSGSFWSSEIKDLVVCLLRHGAQVDLKDGQGQTALHIAAQKYHFVSVVQLLIDSGADVNKTDNDGETPLRKAMKNQDAEIVECLINAGADIDFVCKSTGKRFIFDATNESILKMLIDNVANVKPINGDSPLNSLLAKRDIGVKNVKRLIDAGCDVNHVNNDGNTAIIHAAKYLDIKLLELLVQEGADVNASGRNFPYKTAITSMLIKLWNDRERVTSCINYLIDQNANIDKVKSSVIHTLITSGSLSLIPRFISNGLAPSYLSIDKPANSLFISTTRFSPLMMAVLLNQSDMAEYFFNIKYLMKSDIDVLHGNEDSQILVEEDSDLNSLDLQETIELSPLPLETLCFVRISDILGPIQDRRLKVQKLGLPQPMQDSLMFKNASGCDIKDVGERNLYLFKLSLQHLNLYEVKAYDDDDDSYFFSDEDYIVSSSDEETD